jgi:hypothetical protein
MAWARPSKCPDLICGRDRNNEWGIIDKNNQLRQPDLVIHYQMFENKEG